MEIIHVTDNIFQIHGHEFIDGRVLLVFVLINDATQHLADLLCLRVLEFRFDPRAQGLTQSWDALQHGVKGLKWKAAAAQLQHRRNATQNWNRVCAPHGNGVEDVSVFSFTNLFLVPVPGVANVGNVGAFVQEDKDGPAPTDNPAQRATDR